MKNENKNLETLLMYIVGVLLPYVLVSILHGFKFDMEEWSVTQTFHYVISTVCLFLLSLAKNNL